MAVIILYLVSLFSQPSFVELHELPMYEGKRVIIEGKVTKYYLTKSNGQMLTLENKGSSVVVYLPYRVDVEYGDVLQVTGRVEKFRDSWEVVVDEGLVQVLEKWDENIVPIQMLAENPTKYLGLNVKTMGYVDMVYDSCFYIRDFNSGCSLLVFYNFSNVSFLSLLGGSSKVCVEGVFSFDKQNLQYRLEVCDSRHGVLFLTEE